MGIRERKAREKRARQELILNAAQEVFLSKGFEQTTIEDIADKAELSKGALYLYFKSKEDLYVAVFLNGLEHLYQQISALRDEFGMTDTDTLLKNLLDMYYDFFHQSPEFIYTMSQVYHGKIREKIAPSIWESTIKMAKACLEVFADIIDQGGRDGIFRKVDCWKTASALWAALTGVMMIIEDDDPQFVKIPQKELLDYTFELFMQTLRK
jgi:TetR/AcrR family transcriptional regulator